MGFDVAVLSKNDIKEIVKEALIEVLSESKIFIGGVDLASTPDTTVTTKVTAEVKKEETKVEPKVEPKAKEVKEETSSDRRAELEAMKYNDLKSLVSSLGGKAVGNREALVNLVLELEGGVTSGENEENENDEAVEEGTEESNDTGITGDSEEESDEDYEDELDETTQEFIDFLKDLPREEIEEIADECRVKYTSKTSNEAIIEKVVADLEVLEKALDILGYYDEEEEETDEDEGSEEEESDTEEAEVEAEDDEEENDIVDELGLNDMGIEELADILAEHDLSTKGKKQALIDRIVKAIEDGTIELSDEEEEEEVVEEVKEVVKATKPLKKVENKYPARTAKEDAIEEEIRSQYTSKKLKDSEIVKFIRSYVDGDPRKLDKEVALGMYIEIQQALVDDDGVVTKLEEPYERNGEYHCCGRELKTLDSGNPYCEICGTEYEE